MHAIALTPALPPGPTTTIMARRSRMAVRCPALQASTMATSREHLDRRDAATDSDAAWERVVQTHARRWRSRRLSEVEMSMKISCGSLERGLHIR